MHFNCFWIFSCGDIITTNVCIFVVARRPPINNNAKERDSMAKLNLIA
jgi:hypothetical protein